MQSIFFMIIFAMYLAIGPVKAMYAIQEEDKTTSSQTKLLRQSPPRKEVYVSIPFKEDVSFETLTDEIYISVFRFLNIRDLGQIVQVSTRWKRITENLDLWRSIGLKLYGSYLSEEDLRDKPKQKVVSHYLSVKVNSSSNLQEAESIVNRYHLDLYAHPFHTRLRVGLVEFFVTENVHQEELIMLGNPGAIEKKISKLMEGKFPHLRHIQEKHSQYKQDMATIRELNDLLVEKGDRCAIGRKINGLGHEGGEYGYEENPLAAKELNDFLVEKGDSRAIERKIDGLTHGRLGYKMDLRALRELNDSLAEKGDPRAIERKFKGLRNDWWGYKKDLAAIRKLHDSLVEKGDLRAIERKISGLGTDGYGFNEGERYDYLGITYGYKKNPTLAREFIESLSLNETPIVRGIGMYIKAAAIKYGLSRLGYEQDRDKTIQFIRDNHIPL